MQADRHTHPFELHLDGQTVGSFAAATGLVAESDDVHLPGLRRAFTVELIDGGLASEYDEWLDYERAQVGKHGEIVGPGPDGAPTRWIFEEAWPVSSRRARGEAAGRIGLHSFVLEIEGVTTEGVATDRAGSPSGSSHPEVLHAEAAEEEGSRIVSFFRRLLERRS